MHLTSRFTGDESRRFAGDSGYVIALTALLLVPLMAFTSLAVDLGAWYARAAQIQRADDAAALAGVAKLSVGLSTARTVACDTLNKNGFANVSGDCTGSNPNLVATVTDVSDATTFKLAVNLWDKNANRYFSRLFTGSGVNIQRKSTGQLIPDTKMGSARNFLGTGNQQMKTGSTARENYWLSQSGPCASKEQGARYETVSDANYGSNSGNGGGSWSRCTGGNTVSNTEYRSTGYFYGISFSQNLTGSYGVQIFDPGYCTGTPTVDNGGSSFSTNFTLRSNNNPLDPSSANILAGPSTNTTCNGWWNFATITNPTKGIYFVQVTTTGTIDTTQDGTNSFGIRVTNGTGTTWNAASSACSSDPFDPDGYYSAGSGPTCPNVFGNGAMGVYANNPTGSGNQQASFYLANVGPENNGKVMQVELWDPGEGAQAIQLINPSGTEANFNWQVACWDPTQTTCTDVSPLGGRGGAPFTSPAGSVSTSVGTLNPAIDVWGNGTSCSPGNPQPGNYRGSCSKYSDRLLILTVQLPSDIDSAYGGAHWWRIRYTSASAPTDRTTWVVKMQGSPVRLVQN